MEEKCKTMQPFKMFIDRNGESLTITVQTANGIFEIIHNGRMIGALKPPGEEWQLLDFEQIADKIPLYEIDLQQKNNNVELHAPEINQIVGEIENHLR